MNFDPKLYLNVFFYYLKRFLSAATLLKFRLCTLSKLKLTIKRFIPTALMSVRHAGDGKTISFAAMSGA